MVEVKGKKAALGRIISSARFGLLGAAALVIGLGVVYGACTERVMPNQFGVQQVRFGPSSGIGDKPFGPGLYFVGPGTTIHPFSREIHLLEASDEEKHTREKSKGNTRLWSSVDSYWSRREHLLGAGTHRRIDAINVQTSDGYAVSCDVSLLYSIEDPVKIAREFGWGSLYVDGFVVNTFRNGVVATLGKMSAEAFYGEESRVQAVTEAEDFLRARFKERGLRVEKLLLRNYLYSESYERSLQDKKVAVQLTVKNRKESLVNEERAKRQEIESRGNAAITIAESEIKAEIAKIRAEAELYSAEVRAKADQELGIAEAEAKKLASEALTNSGGRYVVALETAKMFENIDGAAMTPEQYVAFIRETWALIGLRGGASGGTGR